MSRYTTEVRYICEHFSGLSESVGYNDIEMVIKNSIPKVFDFNFPIFDESYRTVLETKILRHYYTREIGLETVGLWKLKLMTKLNEIMPLYNQYYKSALLEFNPFYDVNLTRQKDIKNNGNNSTEKASTINEDSTQNVTSNSNTEGGTTDNSNTQNNQTGLQTGKNTQLYSDTPQGSIQNLENSTYLTNATINNTNNSDTINGTQTSTSNTTNRQSLDTKTDTTNEKTIKNNENSNTNITNTETYLETVTGKQGTQSYSSALSEYRQTFINIDMMVIDELEELFFGLW